MSRTLIAVSMAFVLVPIPAWAQDAPTAGNEGRPPSSDLPVASVAGIQDLGGGAYIDTNPNADPVTGGASCGGGALPDGQIDCEPGQDAAPPPPPPPTHGEIVSQICPPPPEPTLGLSPSARGYTGTETWMWSQGPHSAGNTGTIRGYAASCTLTASRFTFEVADPYAETYGHPSTYTSTEPGHRGETTDARHFWEVTGSYPLSLTITWARSTSAGSDTITSTATTDYDVAEIRPAPTTSP